MKRLLLALLLLSTLSISACTNSDSDDSGSGGGGNSSLSRNACPLLSLGTRIIDGTECDEAGSPIVALRLIGTDGSGAICSGTMITSTDVLTAAHCFFGGVVAGTVEVNGETSNITEVITHPGVAIDEENLAVLNDAAIVRIATPLSVPTLPIVGSRPVQKYKQCCINSKPHSQQLVYNLTYTYTRNMFVT